ncbi:hypothetical protein MFIFM68171_09730 [Madurella fahalii]|uniref:Uncharacterized protein n=1 Tax=Madurella fahalii TaxID=1157608 RepID=A0ABQ0GP64_9PEZI
MFTVPECLLGRVLAMLQSWVISAWSFVSDLLNRRSAAPHDVEQQDSPKTLLQRSSPQPPRSHTIEHAAWFLEFPRRCYDDEYERGTEPPGHSLQLVAIRHDLHRWHVRVVLEHRLGDASGLPARKKALVDLCHAIDFNSLPLLDDTVTEFSISANRNNTAMRLVHSHLPNGHPFATKSDGFWVNAREDPARFRYPSYTGTGTRQIDLSEVYPIDQISPAVFTARIKSEGEQTYILKQVERLLYMPQDSQALEKELQVLEEVGGQGNIIRLIAAVVSRNPYGTTIDPQQEAPRVLRGILLEHHPGGTLTEALHVERGIQSLILCTGVCTGHMMLPSLRHIMQKR